MRIHRVGKSDPFWEQHPIIRRLASSGISRMLHHAMQSPFAILSAQQGPMNLDPQGRMDNKKSDHELRDLLRHFNVGFFRMKGLWKDDELQAFIPEDSLFIIGINEGDAQSIAELYGQQAYIWGDKGHYWIKETQTGSVYQEGEVANHFTQLAPDDDPEFGWSSVKGRHWVLDPNTPDRASDMVQQLQTTQGPDILQQPPLVASVEDQEWFFCVWEKIPKYASFEGIVKEGAMMPDVPPGHSLQAFFRLIYAKD